MQTSHNDTFHTECIPLEDKVLRKEKGPEKEIFITFSSLGECISALATTKLVCDY